MVVIRNRSIVDENGTRVSVVLPVDEYEELPEDRHDLAVVAERRREPVSSHLRAENRVQATKDQELRTRN